MRIRTAIAAIHSLCLLTAVACSGPATPARDEESHRSAASGGRDRSNAPPVEIQRVVTIEQPFQVHPSDPDAWPQFRGPNRDGKSVTTGIWASLPKPKEVPFLTPGALALVK